jgi:hypothetical protein
VTTRQQIEPAVDARDSSHHPPGPGVTDAARPRRGRVGRAPLATLVLVACQRAGSAPTPPDGSVGRVATAAVPAILRSDGRAGDVVLRGRGDAALVFAATPDPAGHRPLVGALLDARVGDKRGDPLFFARPAWFSPDGRAHPLVSRDLVAVRCAGAMGGVRLRGVVDGVRLEQTVCATPGGRFAFDTRALTSLPPGASLGEQIDAGGATTALVDHQGARWHDRAATRALALVENGQALVWEGTGMTVVRGDGAGAHDDDLTALLLQLRFAGAHQTLRLAVVEGDAFAALGARSDAARRVVLRGPAGEVALLDGAGEVLAQGEMPAGGSRVIRLPAGFGAQVRFTDARGVHSAPVALAAEVTAPATIATTVRLRYADGAGAALPVHVLFHALDPGRPEPTPRVLGAGFAAGRSVYLLQGTGEVSLVPGRYRVTANHGPQYGLDVQEIVVAGDAPMELRGTLAEVVPTPDWIAGDLHLHSIRSPDSRVPLDERVGALLCAGVDFAVATDHNHVTDYTDAVAQTGGGSRLAAMQGVEVTTYGPSWGHFIAFPMPTPGGRSGGAVPFFGTTPARIFADARQRGAQVVQVNHPRMEPQMGYFNFTRFEARSGRADRSFAEGFDAVEVFNGLLIESPSAVRAVLRDLVGLARRGLHPAATGNSDSHKLLYEEAGWPRTLVRAARQPVAGRGGRVLDGIRRGHTVVSGGPLVELTAAGGALPGDTVRPVDGEVLVRIRVSAPAWISVDRVELWIDDAPAQTFMVPGPPVDGVRFEREVRVAVRRDAVLLAWAEGRTPLPDVLPTARAMPVGFTTPIYVDADGDGRVVIPPSAPASSTPSSASDASIRRLLAGVDGAACIRGDHRGGRASDGRRDEQHREAGERRAHRAAMHVAPGLSGGWHRATTVLEASR